MLNLTMREFYELLLMQMAKQKIASDEDREIDLFNKNY